MVVTGTMRNKCTTRAAGLICDVKRLKKKEHSACNCRSDGNVFFASACLVLLESVATALLWNKHITLGDECAGLRTKMFHNPTSSMLITKGIKRADALDKLLESHMPKIREKMVFSISHQCTK